MKSTTRLESVLFQLTPTRTRYDLFIVANGIKEKLNSGLLNRFLAHLKTAEDQLSKGSYSIILEPKDDDDAMWFTKGTVERFVRFVSTPEILERVYTIESEIVQIGKAILVQGNNESGINTVEDHQAKHVPRTEACDGSNFTLDADEEKAMVLYMPGPQPPANGYDAREGNSKVQLLKVLETRINVLRKEQGMAFARASAAGFDIDHMAPLVSFAKCFGASRLMDACLKFLDLWKGKHETGQLLETKTAQVMPTLEFSTVNASGTFLSNEKAAVDESADIRPPVDQHNPISQHEYLPGQYAHPMFPPWAMHSPPGVVPFYQGRPTQTPYYQNYSPNGSYYQSPYETWENSQVNVGQRRHSMEGITEPDLRERNILSMKSAYGVEDDNETSHLRSQKKAEKSGKKQLRTVVDGKINITSGMDLNSESESEVGKGDGDLCNNTPNMMDQGHMRSFKRKVSEGKPIGEMTLHDKEKASTADCGNWQAFQNCLLRDTEEDSCAPSDTMFARERNIQIRPQHTGCHDPLASVERDTVELQAGRLTESQKDDGNVFNFPRVSKDESSVYREGTHLSGRLETGVMHMTGFKGRNILYENVIYEASFGGEKESQSNLGSSSDLTIKGYEIATDNLAYMVDESFTLPFRSVSVNQVNSVGRAVTDINFELPSTHQSSVNVGENIGNQARYESNELSLLPERWSEKRHIGYDPTLDYEKQILLNDAASKHTESSADVKQGSKKIEGKKKSRAVSETLDKKKSRGPVMKGKPLKTNPLEEARIRAERLRSYKADLQKLRKEKEEAEQKRIESLKMERKKRISARGSLTSGHSLLPCTSRKSLPEKLSPISHKGSKFSDSEPGSSSPLQRSKIRTALFGATDSRVSMVPKSVDTSHKTINRLTRSVSVTKTESNVTTPDSKASMARIRRLSEPKTISSHSASSEKISSAGSGLKVKASSNEFDGKKATATTNRYHRNVLSLPEFKIEPFKGPVKVNQKKSAEKLFEGKKASALANVDNRKVLSIPETEIEPSKGPVKVKQKKLAEKEMTLNINGEKSFVTSGNDKLEGLDGRIPHHNVDDDPVIEKTVVMLECQKPFAPVVPASEEKLCISRIDNHNNINGDTNLAVPECKSVDATTSPLDRVQNEPTIQTLESPSSDEVMTNNKEKKSANLPVTSALIKSDEVPSAQVSSLEYRSSKYRKLQLTSLGSACDKTGELHISGFKHMKLEKVPKALEPVKEPSKSLKRFLKLGRRNHSSTSKAGEQIAESHSATIANGSEPRETATKTDSTIKVHTLRKLLSQEEQTPTAAQSSQKYSHHFSLLSPFRSKASEKKLIT